jgi:hypothetical protein
MIPPGQIAPLRLEHSFRASPEEVFDAWTNPEVMRRGTAEGAGSGLGGYSVLQADSLAAAADLAKGCPLIGGGGTVDVYETIPM